MSAIRNWFYKIRNNDIKNSRKIAMLIGQFYLIKNKDDYVETKEEIETLNITSVKSRGNKIFITLTRPGLLIGGRGSNINSLTTYLSRELGRVININIIEDKILSKLIPSEIYDNL